MAQSNYSPDPSSDVQTVSYGNLGNLRGSGDPNGIVFGRSGWSFYDLDLGDLYFNTGESRNSVWTLFSSGGGGGASVEVYSGNYAGVAPGITPAGTVAIAFDTSNGTQWNWYSAAWH